MAGKIPLYKIFTDREDNRAVNKVLQRGMDWALGLIKKGKPCALILIRDFID